MWLSEYDPRLLELYDISYMKKEKVLGWLELKEVEKVFDIVIEKISPNDEFGDPEKAFRKFLRKIRKVELEKTSEYSDGESDESESMESDNSESDNSESDDSEYVESDDCESVESDSDRKLEARYDEEEVRRSKQCEQINLEEMSRYKQFISAIYYLFNHHIPSYSFILPLAITYEESNKLPKELLGSSTSVK